MKKKVIVINSMQTDYVYHRTMPVGDMSDFPKFKPRYSPLQMLRMGVFEGKYLDPQSCGKEFPLEWRKHLHSTSDKANNYFGVKSRLPLQDWKAKGWIHVDDPRGWFEWYCRFWMGRRHEDDARQIERWRLFAPRHAGAIKKHCPANGDKNSPNVKCRARQRQALLQWSHFPFV